jgi:RNA 2',3'-cyclic 3'-phosphodiesterase
MPVGGMDADAAGRLFLGVALGEEARREVDARLRRALPGGVPGRAVPAASWHLTLRFLGATRARQLDAVRDHLRRARPGGGFVVRFGGLGAFPRARNARVLWIGVVEDAERLRGLARIAEDAARAAGFAPESRPHTPHLTISRLQPPRDLTAVLDHVPPLGVAFLVREIVLFRSHLGGGPARYEPVERFPLG